MKFYPDVFVRFLTPDNPNEKQVKKEIKFAKQLFKKDDGKLFRGYGELGSWGDSSGTNFELISPDAPVFLKIYKIAEKYNLMAMWHPGEGHETAIRRILKQFPNISILHGDQIEDAMPGIMSDYPNAYYSIDTLFGDQYLLHDDETKQGFLDKTADYEPLLQSDIEKWKDVIKAHPGQYMWATDRGGSANLWQFSREVGQRLTDYARHFIAQLAPEVQEKFAYKNAQSLIDKHAKYKKKKKKK